LSYSAAVIGLGQIGQGYDYNCDDSSFISTHASGYLHHKSFALVGGADLDANRRQEFQKKYNKPTFADVHELMVETEPDVVSIAVPTHYHSDVFNEIIAHSPVAVVCEKPIADSLTEAEEMVTRARDRNCALVINYTRRFEPGANELKKKIRDGFFGEIYKGTVWYSKGLMNNGAHFIDLLMYFFGGASEIKLINKGRYWEGTDPEPGFSIQFGEVEVIFLAGRQECFEINRLELIGTNGRIEYGKGRIEYQLIKPDPVFSGYKILDDKKNKIATDSMRYQLYVFEHLAQHLNDNLPLNSNGDTAIETLNVVEQIKERL